MTLCIWGGGRQKQINEGLGSERGEGIPGKVKKKPRPSSNRGPKLGGKKKQ